MDWVSFLWGIGAILFVNIVYLTSTFNRKCNTFFSKYEKDIVSLNNEKDELTLALETLESSFKLRKSCPACGVEFSLYILEENVEGIEGVDT